MLCFGNHPRFLLGVLLWVAASTAFMVQKSWREGEQEEVEKCEVPNSLIALALGDNVAVVRRCHVVGMAGSERVALGGAWRVVTPCQCNFVVNQS